MKKGLLFLTILISLFAGRIYAQCSGNQTKTFKPTSIGIVIYSNDPETVWNALRLANYAISGGDTVNIFLLGKGVELNSLDISHFNVKEQTDNYLKSGGKILACGTCLESRNISNPKACTVSSMSDLYEMIRKSKTVLTF